MIAQEMRDYLARHAPELKICELDRPHTTEYIASVWNVAPAQVAKTLTLRVGREVVVAVIPGDARLDNRKSKDALGGKARMLAGEEASALTGHPVGGITPLRLAAPLPVYFDIGLRRFDEVVTAAGATHAAIRVPPSRFAEIVGARWVDICSPPSAQ